jgi:OPA family glycerol-3-phosphate transporter-like MFS transporter 1/2
MKSCTAPKVQVFLLTFLAYSSMHSIRTSWSYSKSLMQNHQTSLNLSNQYLGFGDTAFLLFYSIGLALLGPMGDHLPQRYFLSSGYALAAISFLIFPAGYHFFGWTNPWILIITLATNGLGESVGMPGSMNVLSKWFNGENKGSIVGLWAGCRNLGNIFGLVASTIITQYLHLRWEYNFFFTGLLALAFAFLVLLFLQ